jgi:cell division inhibitor SepF
MSMFRKAMVYLGLVDDEEYYGDDEYYGDESYPEEPAPARSSRTTTPTAAPAAESSSPVTVIRRGREREDTGVMAAVPRATPSVKPMPMAARPVHKIEPRGFNDAQEVGDRLKAGQPVIINLQGRDRDLQRRLIDFSSGLAYALNGTMEKVADQVFLLTPPNVEVSEEERERLQSRGLYRAART